MSAYSIHETSVPDALPVRILIADDHEVIRRGLRFLLAPCLDWEICGEASNGVQAVTMARQLKPDVLILDVSMPEMNGLDVARIVHRELPETEILFLSQYDPAEMLLRALETGARGYISKADMGRDLIAAVEAAVHHLPPVESVAQDQARVLSQVEIQPIKNPRGTKEGSFGTAANASPRPRHEKEPPEQTENERDRSYALFMQMPVAMAKLTGPEHRWEFANPKYLALRGFERIAENTGKTVRETFPEFEEQGILRILDEVYRTGNPCSLKAQKIFFRFSSTHIEEGYFDITYQPVRDAQGNTEGILLHASNAAAPIFSEEILEERSNQRKGQKATHSGEINKSAGNFPAFSGRLLQLHDDERRTIARELHDNSGQLVAALAINLSVVNKDRGRLSHGGSRAVSECAALVEDLSEKLCDLSQVLHPPLLDEAGVASALRWFVEQFAKGSKIAVDLRVSPNLGRLPQEIETALFRIVQECLTNIQRHSGSTEAAIVIERIPHGVRLCVSDRGVGIPIEWQTEFQSSTQSCLGIQGMKERVRHLGGQLEIHSGSEGAIVSVVLPVAEDAAGNPPEKKSATSRA